MLEFQNKQKTDLPAGSRDYRGRIPVGPNQGYEAVDNAYREEVSPVAILSLECDETAGKAGCAWHGNYRITEIWPLSQVIENGEATPQWAATEGMQFKLEEGNYIEEGETMRIERPAVEEILAVKKLVENKLGKPSRGNIIYHLDKEQLKHYSQDEINKIFSNN